MKKDERFLIVGEKEYNKYNLSEYPNFHKSGSKEGMRHLQDITGRITDARIYGIDNPVVRCRIDGVQQMGARLTKADIIQMGSRKGDEMKGFALSMAVKHFTAELQKSIGQNKGIKR